MSLPSQIIIPVVATVLALPPAIAILIKFARYVHRKHSRRQQRSDNGILPYSEPPLSLRVATPEVYDGRYIQRTGTAHNGRMFLFGSRTTETWTHIYELQ
ncbi:hypothetical protein F5Y14DRAFT_427431 [Nemania sp. NC0429]|nr:hypothetical protein F5Y14DRAFT_427431 [Nemania sp. NC0429]